jgi:hypothetical protein
MTDEISKVLLKGDDLNIKIKVDGGRMRISASSLEGTSLGLKPDEGLEIVLKDGSIVVWRRPVNPITGVIAPVAVSNVGLNPKFDEEIT